MYPGGEVRRSMYPDPGNRTKREYKRTNIDESHESHDETADEIPLPVSGSLPPEGGGGGALLDNSSEFAITQEAAPRKPSSFTLLGKRKIVRAGAVIDELYPPEEVLFLTGTIAGGGRKVDEAVAAHSHIFVKRLKDWLVVHGAIRFDLYVWELQKRGTPHLHYLCVCPDKAQREYICEHFKSEWIRIVDAICIESGVDLWRQGFGKHLKHRKDYIQVYAQECRRSSARYLSKYASKESSKTKGLRFSRWWGVSRPLSAEIEKRTTINDEYCPSYSAARRKFREFAEDASIFANASWSYVHRVGVGETSVSYFSSQSNLIRFVEQYMNIKFNSLPIDCQRQIESSGLVLLLERLSCTFAAYQRSFKLTTEQSYQVSVLLEFSDSWRTGDPRVIVEWIKALVRVSEFMTCQRLAGVMDDARARAHAGHVRGLIQLRDYCRSSDGFTYTGFLKASGTVFRAMYRDIDEADANVMLSRVVARSSSYAREERKASSNEPGPASMWLFDIDEHAG